jgi:predicted dehydrogenase
MSSGKGFTAPSDTLNVAGVGVGGMGRSNLTNLASENVVALCDVDWEYANRGFAGLEANIRASRSGLDRTTPRVDAQGRPEAPLTATDRQRIPMEIARMKRLKDEHVPRATRYQDYRQMLERQKDIDAVVIATPDHMHAPSRSPPWISASTSTCRSR